MIIYLHELLQYSRSTIRIMQQTSYFPTPPKPNPHLHLLTTQCQSLLQLSAAELQSEAMLQVAVAEMRTHNDRQMYAIEYVYMCNT